MGQGPLAGVKIVEISSIGPGPFAAMMLADQGADIIRVDRPGGGLASVTGSEWNLLLRGRPYVEADLKTEEGKQLVLTLCEQADALIEGYRPGVMERLGLGPDEIRAVNPKLVYGRMTGYGQDGPMAKVAGHDINYISIGGALGAIGRTGERPQPPLNLVGDFGGGGMLLAYGVCAALLEARQSGEGQVVDAAMVEGTAVLMTLMHAMFQNNSWTATPGENLLDSGAHFYEVYATKDGGHVAVGAIEPQFYSELLRLLEIPEAEMGQWERERWPEFKDRLAEVFLTKTRDEWAAILEPAETCATGVYGLADAHEHPHNVARNTFVEVNGVRQPAPAPRFSRTPGAINGGPPPDPSELGDVLRSWGVSDTKIAALST